ncbi:transcriptional regulator [Vibrio phage ICP1]|nr:putative Rha protein [Vibrio phage ICP1_2017_F_Mathbaria]QVW04135.1 transcriptional regulator [Vibrio phage ICP1]QVW04362.1 transcriptional regulator [Vibrio phage ICP1]QVW05029.1 transcriptional regulator [Vibrio phage ICP1]QVW05255.1 transcriptional regulator [Vibrio phage ICP1]
MQNEITVFGLLDSETQTTTTLLVAEKFGKRHADILRSINKQVLPNISPDFAQRNFAFTKKFNELANRETEHYNLTKDGFSMVAMSMTGKEAYAWKEAFIKEFNRLEEENQVLKSIVWQVINGKNYLPQELGAQAAGIEHLRLFMKYIKQRENVLKWFMDKNLLEHKRVGKTAQDTAWRWTQSGFKYILSNRQHLNARVKEMHEQERNGTLVF